mgnify:CR=1 FL=1
MCTQPTPIQVSTSSKAWLSIYQKNASTQISPDMHSTNESLRNGAILSSVCEKNIIYQKQSSHTNKKDTNMQQKLVSWMDAKHWKVITLFIVHSCILPNQITRRDQIGLLQGCNVGYGQFQAQVMILRMDENLGIMRRSFTSWYSNLQLLFFFFFHSPLFHTFFHTFSFAIDLQLSSFFSFFSLFFFTIPFYMYISILKPIGICGYEKKG